jgi:glycosyltransferase involved in cell wall biosynthesis
MDDVRPDLSICIPTYNRGPFLEFLLKDCHKNLDLVKSNIELVICDNASEDNTSEVIAYWSNILPIRSFRQKTNVGASGNLNTAYSISSGKYCIYLADDDTLLWNQIDVSLTLLKNNPEVKVMHAPWWVGDFPKTENGVQWYSLGENQVIGRHQFDNAIDLILNHKIFPEIFIFDLDHFKAHLPLGYDNRISYHYFLLLFQWLSVSSVIFSKTPFYHSIMTHPAGYRDQAGTSQVMIAWDEYRGGMELFLAAIARTNCEEYRRLIDTFVLSRMKVGLRIRVGKGEAPIESYLLARRIQANGEVLPDNLLQRVRLMACIEYFCTVMFPVSRRSSIGITENVSLDALRVLDRYATTGYLLVHEGQVVDDLLILNLTDHEVTVFGECDVIREQTLLSYFPV